MAYLGSDWVDTVPIAGGAPTSICTNSLGQKTKLVQQTRGPAPVWLDYGYDMSTGNRSSLTSHAMNGTVKNVTYNYPAAGSARPHAVSSLSGDSGLGAGTYDTDAAGNVTALPGKTLTYNENGKLASVSTGTNTQTQIYDASGNLLLRVSSVEGAALFLGDTVVTKKTIGTTVYGARTYDGARGIPVAERNANTGVAGSIVTWLFADVTGTVDTQTVAATGVTDQRFRDPFGNPLGGASSYWDDGNGYLNKPGTGSTGLTTIGARTYVAILGRFLTVDPITDPNNPQQNTGYVYGHNNPLTWPDPSGLLPGNMLSDGCGRGACGVKAAKAWSPRTYSTPPGYEEAVATGNKMFDQGRRALDSISDEPLWTRPWSRFGSDAKAGAGAYLNMNMGSFLRSAQGALVYGWARGTLPSTLPFNSQSMITQGLKQSTFMQGYRSEARANVMAGRSLAVGEYKAGDYTFSNKKLLNDLETMLWWEGASNADRSLAVIGSFGVTAVVKDSEIGSAVVEFEIKNDMSLGSGAGFLGDENRAFLNSLVGITGPFSVVHQTFTWTETLTW